MKLAEVDALPAAVLPIATVYPPDHLLIWHEHRRAQFLCAATGTMQVETDEGAWTVPTERAVLIPPHTRHQVQMLGVETNSLYIDPAAVPEWPNACRVVEVGALLHELLRTAVDIDPRGEIGERDSTVLTLILHELSRLAEVPLHVPIPPEEPFGRLCRQYLAVPDLAVGNSQWAREAGMSERTLTRKFRDEIGMSPAAWRSRARLLAAIPLLRHQSVTDVAARLGYATPAAFSYAFTRAFHVAPSRLSR
ncbi:AraC family transcriptional regulator [Ruania zhangjianzhongii]|uniref:AraC family transcriptional regulator n=1 Tax=Ruania zhangjianzhongii TaxID=2603206 RepID=UPI001FD15C35|nr:helix-turn-helix transcriptional regulator [Ruania zhangjianzhongii]